MAKPLTRILRKLCNMMGYDLLRLQKTDIHPEAVSGLGRGGGFDAFEAVAPRAVRQLDIYLRSCARVEIFAQSRSRFIGVPKCEVVARCLNSLVRSIAYAQEQGLETPVRLTVLDDHSSDDCVARIKAVLAKAPCPTQFRALKGTGVGASLTEMYRLARDEAVDLIYFTADDFLHEDRAILELTQSYGLLAAVLKRDPVLFISDYPERYRHVYPTHILLGSHRHWRSVHGTNGADTLSREILLKYWDLYLAFGQYGIDPNITEENTIDRIYQEVPCYSPLPSLAVHFQHFDTLSPYFDWQKWWERSRS
ncbi:MAG: glycosyltransferase family A protein [Pseudomonadota bacterium]